MRSPFAPLSLLVFVAAIAFLVAFVQLGVLTIAFDKLGLSPSSAFLLLLTSLAGSTINLPLFRVQAHPPPAGYVAFPWRGLLRQPERAFTGKTLIAVNVGGCMIPIAFSIYLLQHNPLPAGQVLAAIAVVTLVSRVISRPIPGLGIGMPVLVAPITAAAVSILINDEQSAPLAYVAGTLGVLIGADLLRLDAIRRFGAPFASIGGAGTFDGIFITGLVAVLLA